MPSLCDGVLGQAAKPRDGMTVLCQGVTDRFFQACSSICPQYADTLEYQGAPNNNLCRLTTRLLTCLDRSTMHPTTRSAEDAAISTTKLSTLGPSPALLMLHGARLWACLLTVGTRLANCRPPIHNQRHGTLTPDSRGGCVCAAPYPEVFPVHRAVSSCVI